MAYSYKAGRENKQKESSNWKEKEARKIIEAWQKSGLSIAAFCRERNILPKRMYRWCKLFGIKKHTKKDPTKRKQKTSSLRLVEAEIINSCKESSLITIGIGNEVRIEVKTPDAVSVEWVTLLAKGIANQVSK